jgi:hypothetical protein
LTTDRFGNANKAYSFDGNDVITINSTTALSLQNKFTISLWVVRNNNGYMGFISKRRDATGGITYHISGSESVQEVGINNDPPGGGCPSCNIGSGNSSSNLSNWNHFVGVWDGTRLKFYQNGNLVSDVNGVLGNNNTLINFNSPVEIGRYLSSSLNGKLDDIAIWNRALTESEIKNIYNGNICYQNVTVTDTLLINTAITGFNPITYQNTIKVYPNPSKDQITVDFGNFNTLNGYQLKITNSIGQQMYQTAINKQSVNISLGSWTGKGLYYIQIFDNNGINIETRKILIQ